MGSPLPSTTAIALSYAQPATPWASSSTSSLVYHFDLNGSGSTVVPIVIGYHFSVGAVMDPNLSIYISPPTNYSGASISVRGPGGLALEERSEAFADAGGPAICRTTIFGSFSQACVSGSGFAVVDGEYHFNAQVGDDWILSALSDAHAYGGASNSAASVSVFIDPTFADAASYQIAFSDGVSVSVPEPAPTTSILAGILGLGFMKRRRRD